MQAATHQAVITGGTGGLGKAIAEVLAAPDSCGVDEAPYFSGNLNLLVDWVASGAG